MRGAFGTQDKPPAGFTLDQASAPTPPDGFELDAPDVYEPTPAPNANAGGFGKAVVEGAKQTGRALGTAFDVVTDDKQDIYEDAQVTPDRSGAQQRFHQALAQRKDEYGDDGVWQGIKNVAGAVAEEPMGAFQEVGAQLPNSAAVMGGMFAGAKIGAAAGPVGAIVGGIAGLLLGNTAIETGYIAQDQAREGNLDTDKALAQGAIKGGVITGIDAATIGLNKLMFGAPGKAAAKASQEAVEGILAKAGVDMADHAAVTTALRLDPALKTAVLEGGKAAYIGALPGKLKKAAQAAAAMGSETVSEGAGEYLGSAAAGLDASFTEAVLEGLMSLPQSAGEAGISAMLAKRDQPGFEVNVPEDPNAPWPGYQVDEREASPGDVAAFNPPFPGTEGIQVEDGARHPGRGDAADPAAGDGCPLPPAGDRHAGRAGRADHH